MKTVLWVLLIVVALYFGLQGGEYSTRDLYVLRARGQSLQREVDSLQLRVDSLTGYLRAVRSDSATQERIAREEFGMVRGEKELLYRFGDSMSR
ncbi:MAG TPA: septum formation initiator family protein [Gemmatimonadaceae bacterium]|nr:septum formation initiator family protein [Gemmatimonadaceae bacterium]